MVSIDKAVLARYSREGKHFEIYVDPVLALSFKQGKNVAINEILAAQEVYKDAKKGDRVSPGDMEAVFNTSDVLEVSKQIIQKGELQLTTEQRKQMVEEKKKSIVAFIAREAFNPQTKMPHPPQRIESALDEASFNVDPFESVDTQAEKALKALKELIPISMEQLRIEVIVPPAYTGSAYSTIRKYGVEKEDWLNDGTLKAVVKIPAGVEADFYDQISVITKGDAEFKRLDVQGGN